MPIALPLMSSDARQRWPSSAPPTSRMPVAPRRLYEISRWIRREPAGLCRKRESDTEKSSADLCSTSASATDGVAPPPPSPGARAGSSTPRTRTQSLCATTSDSTLSCSEPRRFSLSTISRKISTSMFTCLPIPVHDTECSWREASSAGTKWSSRSFRNSEKSFRWLSRAMCASLRSSWSISARAPLEGTQLRRWPNQRLALPAPSVRAMSSSLNSPT